MKGADWTAELDQMESVLRDMAKIIYGYYKALRVEGFEREDAIALVIEYQANLQAGGTNE